MSVSLTSETGTRAPAVQPHPFGSERSRRLLIVCHTGQISGAESMLIDIAQHYGERCHVLLFADGPLRARLATLGIRHTVLPAGRGMTGVRREASRLRALLAAPAVALLAWRVARIARGYDVLYPNSQKAAVVTMLVAWLQRRTLIWHLHDILSPEHFAPLQRWLVTRLANRSARRVIVVSQAARAAFIASGGDPARVVVVYNGIDPARFMAPCEPARILQIRRSCGAGDAALIAVFGRITPWKGHHVLLRALPALPGVHALVVGAALFGETSTLTALQELARTLGVADRVHWLGQRDDVPDLLQAVDVVLHTATAAEPFGLVIAEGMLAGRPVIATDHGASRELLGDDPGVLVRPGDPALLADAVRTVLLLSPQSRAALGASNRARARALFSLHTMLAGVERIVALNASA